MSLPSAPSPSSPTSSASTGGRTADLRVPLEGEAGRPSLASVSSHPMPSERIQRQIEALLDQAEHAVTAGDWDAALERVRGVLAIDADNADAQALSAIAEAARGQRQIKALLDQAEQAVTAGDWDAALERVRGVLAIDADNADARTLGAIAEAARGDRR